MDLRKYLKSVDIFAFIFFFFIITGIPSKAEANLGRLLTVTVKAIGKTNSGRSIPYHIRAERLVRDPRFRARVFKSLPNTTLGEQLTKAWRYTNSPSAQIALERELHIIKVVEHLKKTTKHDNDEVFQVAHRLLSKSLDNSNISAFRSQVRLEKELLKQIELLPKKLKITSDKPPITFEITTGKLTLPEIGTVGPILVKGGEVNIYIATTALSAMIFCGTSDCLTSEDNEGSKMDKPTDQVFSLIQTEELLRRSALKDPTFNKTISVLLEDAEKSVQIK